MNPTLAAALSCGGARGLLEFRKSFSSGQEAFNYFIVGGLFLAVGLFLRQPTDGSAVPFGTMFIAGGVGFIVAMSGLINVAQILSADREDGTLLRAKSLPNGMHTYIVAKIVHIFLITATNTAIVVIPGLFLIPGFSLSAESAPWLVLVIALGLAATVPLGAIMGALIKNPRTTMGLLMLPIMGISMLSGIFTPIATMPGWAQLIAQVFPVYWVGLGTRAALLPDAAVSAEIGQSWRYLETFGVLGVWAVVGLAVAPVLLRRMARNATGSQLLEARDRALQSPA